MYQVTTKLEISVLQNKENMFQSEKIESSLLDIIENKMLCIYAQIINVSLILV